MNQNEQSLIDVLASILISEFETLATEGVDWVKSKLEPHAATIINTVSAPPAAQE